MKGYFDRFHKSGKLSSKATSKRPNQESLAQESSQPTLQHDLQEFGIKLAVLEKEQNLFSSAQQWQNTGHLTRTCRLLRDLRILEGRLRNVSTTNTAMRFRINNTLLRFQSFKTMHRRFWEAVADYIT